MRVHWIFRGDYGEGARVSAWGGVSPRRIADYVAALEWQCPAHEAALVWRSLSQVERDALTTTVAAAIATAKGFQS